MSSSPHSQEDRSASCTDPSQQDTSHLAEQSDQQQDGSSLDSQSTQQQAASTQSTQQQAASKESEKLMECDTAFCAQNVSVAYHDNVVLKNVNLKVPNGVVMGLIGPNGAGKSTLIKAAMGLVPTLTGSFSFTGKDLAHARKFTGYMPQIASVDWDFPATVFDAVLMGTYGKLGWFKRPGAKEKATAEKALAMVGILDLAKRQIGELSGGQRQRTFLARTLAKEPDLYIMDEPFAGVDKSSESAIISVLEELKDQGKTVIIVHHDLSTLDQFCDWVAMLNVTLRAAGPINDVFTTEQLKSTYGVTDAKVLIGNK